MNTPRTYYPLNDILEQLGRKNDRSNRIILLQELHDFQIPLFVFDDEGVTFSGLFNTDDYRMIVDNPDESFEFSEIISIDGGTVETSHGKKTNYIPEPLGIPYDVKYKNCFLIKKNFNLYLKKIKQSELHNDLIVYNGEAFEENKLNIEPAQKCITKRIIFDFGGAFITIDKKEYEATPQQLYVIHVYYELYIKYKNGDCSSPNQHEKDSIPEARRRNNNTSTIETYKMSNVFGAKSKKLKETFLFKVKRGIYRLKTD